MSGPERINSDTTRDNLLGVGPTLLIGPIPSRAMREHPVLVVLDGRRTSRRFEIKQEAFLVGRDEACELVLNDANCSRHHAKLTYSNLNDTEGKPRIVLTDLESRNGTYVNDVKVSTVELQHGDKILLGRTLVSFYLWDEATLRAEETLLRSANTDALTGLYNRGFFQNTISREFERALRYQRELSLVILDLDYFKSVNDNYGHPVGDKVLIEVANLCLESSRGNDFPCRFGGEEFMIILPETSLEDATAYAVRLREKIKALEIQVGAATIHITASLGVAAIHPAMQDPDELVKLVDSMMYRAKNEGRDRVCSATGEAQELELTRSNSQLGSS